MDIDITNYLRINLTDMILVCVSTLLLVLIAKRFFWDVVTNYFDQRAAYIQSELDAGESARQAGEAYKEQYETQMKQVKQEAGELLEQARSQAESTRRDILQKANDEAANLKAKARDDMEQERAKAQQEMADTIRNLAFEAASHIVEKEIDETKHTDYVNDFIAKAGEETWQA